MSAKSSIIDQLDRFIPQKGKFSVIESRANHIITSAINLIETIEENFNEEESEKLIRRIFSSVKTKNPQKFQNSIRQLKEIYDGKQKSRIID